jgi:diketogulonate reductase-like aldo/keto reductase
MGVLPQNRSEEIRALQTGIDLGLTVIDTAEMYGNGRSEELVGQAIAGRREEVFLISKVLPSNASRGGTKLACEQSLKRLNTDVLDLYLLHWKGSDPFEETVAGMLDLVAEGKVRQWGVSNMSVTDMTAFCALQKGSPCAANQVLYNLSRRGIEYDLIPWCQEHNIPIIAYSPVEQGRLLNDATLAAIAKKHGATSAQIALAWAIRNPNILAIPKAGTVDHVRDNAASLSVRLTEEDLTLLDRSSPPPAWKSPLEML